jgi:hypothetical protein
MATTKIENAKTLWRRRTYIHMRLPLLREEMKSLNSERKEINDKLKGKTGEDTPELKHLRRKKLYIAVRAEILAAEQKALLDERKTFPEMLET